MLQKDDSEWVQKCTDCEVWDKCTWKEVVEAYVKNVITKIDDIHRSQWRKVIRGGQCA